MVSKVILMYALGTWVMLSFVLLVAIAYAARKSAAKVAGSILKAPVETVELGAAAIEFNSMEIENEQKNTPVIHSGYGRQVGI